MSDHTKEPWDGDYAAIFVSDVDIAMCVDHDVGREVSIANARRIVACVNACAGIADPSAIPDAIHALQKLVEWACEHVRKGDDWHMIEQIERTLTKLKGGA